MTKQSELTWIAEARKNIGVKEIVGKLHSAIILEWLRELKAWYKDDETPWCGTFVAHCLNSSGIGIPKDWYRAKEYLNHGTKLDKPAYGCVVVFSRNGGGHVGFVVGKDKAGNIMVLGGNQGNAVNIKPFSTARVVGYRWYGTQPKPNDIRYQLPLLNSDGKLSNNEA